MYANRAASIESGIDRLLREKTSVLEWPTLRAEGLLPDQENDRFDEVVRREAFARAQEYLDFNVNSSEDDIMLRCVFIDWLVSHALLGSSEFLLADGILHRVNIEHGVDIDAQALRNRVVGPLRDHGVLIASSTKGYKIPDCLEDLKKYVDLCASQIPPAVSRLRRARDALRLATGGELDLLAGHDLAHLRSIADSL